ncbi:hypothetical protein ANRL4_05212 [Anaerolineae bacterium]|nr:hypothetical protein ANRL4_05212 [Anaerolineae bacterium]
MLKYTGHFVFDVGLTTVLALCKKFDPGRLTEIDLKKVADFIQENYAQDPLRSAYTVAFTSGAWFSQPAFWTQPEKQRDYAERVLRGYGSNIPILDEPCVFTGEPAVRIAFSDKLPTGRAFRQHIPMTLGENVINFYAGGDAGLPVSGKALLCIQAFPLGCSKCGGKLLAVHSDNPDIMYTFAARFLDENRKLISLAREEGSTKLKEAPFPAKTLLIKTLIEIEQERQEERAEQRPYSVTAYHLSNGGQSTALDTRNPPLEIYHLPLELTSFLGAIVHTEFQSEWRAVERRAWWYSQKKEKNSEEDKPRKRKSKKAIPDKAVDVVFSRNALYEDLFDLPDKVRYFVRRYFLGKSPDAASWKLAELLMKEVIHMDKSLLEDIRRLGDKLGSYVQETGDKQFYGGFFAENRYDHFRDLLMRVNRRRLKANEEPIISLDEFFSVFESEVEGVPRYDRWKLARDLVLIRMTEFLYKAGKLKDLTDVIPDVEELEDSQP